MSAPIVVRGDARALPLPDESVHAIVCDPPYEISMMSKKWDSTGVAFDTGPWREALRVLKPGGHMAVFGAPRTYHRVACAIEDAGFEMRDSIMAWTFGSGFPKSLDVGKAIDKRPGVEHHAAFAAHLAQRRVAASLTRADVSERVVGTRTGACWNWEHHQFPEAKWWPALRDLLDLDPVWDAVIAEAERAVIGMKRSGIAVPGEGQRDTIGGSRAVDVDITAPATDAARAWQGWGTALKPAWEPVLVAQKPSPPAGTEESGLSPQCEPILLARKPLDGTVAATVLAHGCGGLNVDACRVEAPDAPDEPVRAPNAGARYVGVRTGGRTSESEARATSATSAGRWPTNVVLAHAPELDPVTGEVVGDACADGCVPGCHVRQLDEQSGERPSGGSTHERSTARADTFGQYTAGRNVSRERDSGGASRFYPTFRYTAKAPSWQRPQVDGRGFETVKPLDLMRWLVRLLTPPGGVVLDMFPGTGTTGQAAQLEGFRSVLVELEAAHLPFIRERLAQQVVVDRKTDEAVPVTPTPDGAWSLFELGSAS